MSAVAAATDFDRIGDEARYATDEYQPESLQTLRGVTNPILVACSETLRN